MPMRDLPFIARIAGAVTFLRGCCVVIVSSSWAGGGARA